MALCIVVILQIAMCLKIERYVVWILRDWNHVLTERVSDPGFVKDIRVLAGEITHDDV